MYYQDHRCRGVQCWLPCAPPSLHSSGIWSGWSPPTILCPLTKKKKSKKIKPWLFTPSIVTSVGLNRVGTSVSLVNLSCLDAISLGNTHVLRPVRGKDIKPYHSDEKGEGGGWLNYTFWCIHVFLQFHFHWLNYITVYLTLRPRRHHRHSHGATATTAGPQWSLLNPPPRVRPTFRNSDPHHMAKPNPCSQYTVVWIADNAVCTCTRVYSHMLSAELNIWRLPCPTVLLWLQHIQDSTSTSTFEDSCGYTALDMLESKQDCWAKQPTKVVSTSEDLKCWGAWNTTC